MAKRKLNLEKLRIADECEKISRDFMHEIPNMLRALKRDDPYKAIQAWKEITMFSTAQKGKDDAPTAPLAVNINFMPAEKTEDAKCIDITKDQNE